MMIYKSILLVEDDLDDQLIFMEAIKEIDDSLECVIKNDGREALKHLNLCPQLPDILFLDLNMPVMNGKECLLELKKHSRLAKIPVVIYSTHSSELIIKETAQIGIHYYLTKPVDFRSLCNSLKLILKD